MTGKPKKLMVHYQFIKETLEKDPLNILDLAKLMKDKFDVEYNYVYTEVKELVSLNKIKEIKHNNATLLLWTKVELTFEYELSHNKVELDKHFVTFQCVPSKVRQMKLPLYILKHLEKAIGSLGKSMELMLTIEAIKVDNKWHTINKKE